MEAATISLSRVLALGSEAYQDRTLPRRLTAAVGDAGIATLHRDLTPVKHLMAADLNHRTDHALVA